ncbi:MAG TPA: EAL domain-containing protein [Acidimicrobiales bacterium]|nr:EAL domain-containing protein [Acidimicrobiales bacterium]
MSAFQPTVLQDSVLVVDDDQATRDSLASVLKGAGIEVFVASDPTEAFTLRGLQRPAAIVVDHQLADQTGVELAQRMKEEDPDTPVLLLTGLASLDSALAASAQLDGLLVKPLVPQAFIQTVRNALAQRALAVENQRLAERIEELSAQGAAAPAPAAPATPVAPAAPTVFTEPPNRALLEDQLDKALTAARRDSGSLAVLFVELDGWQDVHAQFGGGVAEQVAREVASRLSVARRKSDIVTRVAADKFAVVCADVNSEADALRIASLVLDGAGRPVVVDGVEHWLRATVGIVLTDPGATGETADTVLENAELAMYWARDEGRASQVFDASMRDRVVSRYEIEHGLQSAMDNGELALFYQPVVDLRSGQVVGAEALLRWQRPEQGVLLPGEFLDVAAEVGMADAISRWTLDRALTELVLWRAAENLPAQFRLTLNVSGRQLTDPHFVEMFEGLTRKHGVSPAMISIDLSEDAARAAAGAEGVLARLSAAGVQFNLDDFGAGECRLAWLQELPIHALKIAPEFVATLDSTSNPHGAAMVRALIALGHELHLSMVAEGVETPAQAAALRAIGCELAQGYHLGHPGPREQVWAAPEA